jgi:YYY domain-containing protein
MISFFLWVLVLFLLGTAAFPIVFWLFPHLADRGYGLVKPAGLLIFGYLYWILVTFRILPNTWGGVAGAYLLVILLGCLALWKTGWETIKTWYSGNRWLVLLVEIGFVLLFAFFAFLRAASPDIVGTEKPMELAFINSILRSQTFPPADPWLSGYAISYYYFGYIMVAGLIRLTGTISGVGFNLAIALWFSIAAVGSFSLVLNILSRLKPRGTSSKKDEPLIKKAGWAVLGPVFLIFTANWEGLLELLHSKGIFWNASGQSAFWKWLDVQELTTAPVLPLGWLPSRPGGIWWWRASRVLQDYDLGGKSLEVIDEFPFFSLYLADLHPHVLSIPFVLLACSFALELFAKASSGKYFRTGWYETVMGWLGKPKQPALPDETRMGPGVFWSAALLFGSLAFMNIWDFPIYVGLTSAGIVLARYISNGWNRNRIIEFLETGLAFGITGAILYLPFYIGFSSQAGGLLPSLAFFTPGKNLWVMFGVLFVPILLGLLALINKGDLRSTFKNGFGKTVSLIGGMWLAMLLLGLFFITIPGLLGSLSLRLEASLSALAGQFFSLQGSALSRDILFNTSLLRLASPGGWLTLLLLLTLVWGGAIWLRHRGKDSQSNTPLDTSSKKAEPSQSTLSFILLLVAVGAGLVLFPEFFYLRDQFGTRMNTIFKFYYQAWILWSVAASVLTYIFWKQMGSPLKWVVRAVFLLSMAAGMLYPFYCFADRFGSLTPSRLTLDGNAYFSTGYPDETAAITFLRQAPAGTVAEAVGGSYSAYARVSTQSGQVNVLGWPGHESQWRGGAVEIGSREPDIKLLYQTNDWVEALGIIQKYKIRYIYIGSLENNTYRVNDSKFRSNLAAAYQNNSVVIYEVPDQLLTPKP